jgi:transposase
MGFLFRVGVYGAPTFIFGSNTMENQTTIGYYNKEFSWHNYNESQTKEKAIFVNILNDLCNLIQEKSHDTVGRKPTKTRDIIFALTLKEYLNTSARRVQSELKLFKEAGFIDSEIPFNTLLDHLERIELKAILRELIEISSLPLKEIETDFAIDSSGFSTKRFERWVDVRTVKNGGAQRRRMFRKCHIVCGVKTNIIVSIQITEGHVHDQTQFVPLVQDTARNFKIRDFCADKGYLSGESFATIKDLGGQAFIPFKSNTKGSHHSQSEYRNYFKSAYKFFRDNKEEYTSRYHKRSNVESCFSMIKRKFGNNLMCKKETSQDNEILGKVLANNICVLVQEIFLNNINTNFNFHAEHYVARN